MQRREFLAAGAGLAGFALPAMAVSKSRPCGPSSLSVAGGSRISSECMPSTGPADWFQSLEPMRWASVAGGARMKQSWQQGANLSSVLHGRDYWNQELVSRTGRSVLYGNFPDAVFASWNGASLDQRRGELLIVGNGGHTNGPDNGGYALSLRSDRPEWRRMADATPGSHLVGVGDIDQRTEAAVYLDGRPAAMHTCGVPVWANDRVWFPFQNSYYSSGKSSFATFSFDSGLLEAAPDLSRWRADSTLPWRYHGQVSETAAIGGYTFGRGVYDRKNERVFYFGKSGSSYWYLDVDKASPTFEKSLRIRPHGDFSYTCAWAVNVHGLDRNLIVLGSIHSQDLYVLDADRPDDSRSWRVKNASPQMSWDENNPVGPAGYALEYGAVYHSASRRIFLYNPNTLGAGTMRCLSVPVTGNGNYDDAGTWKWSEIALTAYDDDFPKPLSRGADSAGGVYGRFNLIERMDDAGTSALVAATQVGGPTYVCKLDGPA